MKPIRHNWRISLQERRWKIQTRRKFMSEYFTFIFIYIYFVKDLSRGFNYIYNSTFVDFTFQLILRFGKMFSRRGKSFLLEDRFHQASGHEFIFFNYGRFMTGVAQLFVD